MADLVESVGQDVLDEAAEKLHRMRVAVCAPRVRRVTAVGETSRRRLFERATRWV